MLTLVILANVVFFFAWIYVLAYNNLVSKYYFEESIYQISRGLLWGIIIGLVVAFFVLLPKYIKKEWDLHLVVPYFLSVHLTLSILVNIAQFFVSRFERLFEVGFGLGFVIGGLIAIIAYIGEVRLEHHKKDKQENPELITENDS